MARCLPLVLVCAATVWGELVQIDTSGSLAGAPSDSDSRIDALETRIALLEREAIRQNAVASDLRAALEALRARLPDTANVTAAHSLSSDDTAALSHKFDELFLETAHISHRGELPIAQVFLELRLRDLPRPARAAQGVDWTAPAPTVAADVLATVWRNGSVELAGLPGARPIRLSLDSGAASPVTLCVDRAAGCGVVAAVAGLLPTAVLAVADAASASVILWAVSSASLGPPSRTASADVTGVPTSPSTADEEGVLLRLMCSSAVPQAGGLPVSLLTWTLGVGDASNRLFVGTSAGHVLHLYRNCSTLATYSFAGKKGGGATPVTALARNSYILAAAVGGAMRLVQLDTHQEWTASCVISDGTRSAVASLTYDATLSSLLWAGMSDGSAILLRPIFVDAAAQRRSTCSVVRRVPPPVACASQLSDTAASSARCQDMTIVVGTGAESGPLRLVSRPAAATIVSQRGLVLVGSASCGLAAYVLSWSASAAQVALIAASGADAGIAAESLRCLGAESETVNVSSAIILERPALLLTLGSAHNANERQRRTVGSGSSGLVPLSVAFVQSRSDGLTSQWTHATFSLLPALAAPDASASADSWATLLGSARLPLVLVGLAVGVLYQVWLRSRKAGGGTDEGWTPPPPDGRGEAQPWADGGGSGGDGSDLMRSLLQRAGGSRAGVSSAASSTRALHAAVMAKTAGLGASHGGPSGGAASAATAGWLRAAMGETGHGDGLSRHRREGERAPLLSQPQPLRRSGATAGAVARGSAQGASAGGSDDDSDGFGS